MLDIKKRIAKYMPGKPWDIGMRENWLSAMAAEGLLLERVDKYRAWFTVGEPAKLRYRIDVPGEFFSSERSYKLSQTGWKHVTERGCFDYYSSPAAETAPEIVADADTAVALLNKQMKLQAIKAAISIAAIPLTFLITYLFLGLADSLVYLLVQAQSLLIYYFFWALIPLIYLAFHFFYDRVIIKRIRAEYQNNGSLDRTVPWETAKKSRRKLAVSAGSLFYIVFVPVAALGVLSEYANPFDINSAPVIYLDTLEKDAVRITDGDASQDEETGFYHDYNWSPLAPVHLVTFASGEFQKGESSYESSMNTESYKLRFACLSEKILSDLIAPSSYTESEAVEIEHPGLDKLFIRTKEDGGKEVVAAKNKSVIWLIYWGPADDEAIIDAVVQTIDTLDSYRLENKTNEKFGWIWRFYN